VITESPSSLPADVAPLAYTPGTGFVAAALVMWIFIWLLVAVRVIRRRDLGLAGKVIWLVVILVVPLIGVLVYFLWDAARPGGA
jgi:hypothetical protein